MGCHFSQGSVVRKLAKVVVGLSSGLIVSPTAEKIFMGNQQMEWN